jgi:class 3 adenylate cyclase
MKTLREEKGRSGRHIILMGPGVAVLYWLTESVVHTSIFDNSDFLSELFPEDPNELWMRSLIVLLIIAFSISVHRVVHARTCAAEEKGQLVEECEKALAEVERLSGIVRNTFCRYLAQDVVDQLLESEDRLCLGGETREVSLLMSDLRGFTAHTDGMHPERILALLNRYLGRMVEILLDHQALVDEIVGDGILAVFGAPTHVDDHVERAVACALQMQAAMDSINQLNEVDGFPRLEMGIGINAGQVVVGNIGSERRTKYGVVGSEVNFTGRIESYTLGGQVLISQSAYDTVRDMVEIRDVVQVEMKGLKGTVNLYDVRGISGTYSVKLTETFESPSLIFKRIPVRIGNVQGKTVTNKYGDAWITHLSERSAVVVLPEQLDPREEIKIDLLDETIEETVGEVFGKVISINPVQDHAEALIRFTFVSPEMRRFFRDCIVRPDTDWPEGATPTMSKPPYVAL